MAGILGDHFDPQTGEQRVFGNTVSVVTTIQSVILEPESQKLWVSNRHASPTGLGDFVEVDVENFWSRPVEEELPVIPAASPGPPELYEALAHYRDAYRAWHVDNDQDDFAEKALIALEKALGVYPHDGHLWVQAGILFFHLKRFRDSQAHFEQALGRKLSDHVRNVCHLYMARAYDVLGERKKALAIYKRSSEVSDPKLRRAFLRGRWIPYQSFETPFMVLDFQFPDTFQY
jgi:hypothetical protein